MHRISRALRDGIGPIAILLAAWEVVSRTGLVSERVLPPFSEVAVTAASLVVQGEILPHLGASVYRALAGLALGSLVGVVLGVAMALHAPTRRLAYLSVALLYTPPKSALIPIVFLWLGVGSPAIILVVFLATLVPMVISSFHGAEAVPDRLLWSARAMGTPPRRLLTSVVIPAASPHILNGLRVSMAFAVVVVVSAEMVASFVGVGRFIFRFGESGIYASMFAAIVVVVLVAFLLDQLVAALSSRLLVWTEAEQRDG